MKKKRPSPASKLATDDPIAWITRAAANRDCNLHLEAYLLDRNPKHIKEALNVLLRRRQPISEAMLRNIAHVFQQLVPPESDKNAKKRAAKKPAPFPRNTVRDLRILTAVVFLCDGVLPDRVPGDVLESVARDFNLTTTNVAMIVSRARSRRDGRSIR